MTSYKHGGLEWSDMCNRNAAAFSGDTFPVFKTASKKKKVTKKKKGIFAFLKNM